MKIEGTDIESKIMPLYLQGITIPKIAKEFSIKDCEKLTNAINNFIKDKKANIQKQRVNSISAEDVYNLIKNGKSHYQIAALYNISQYAVKKIIDRYCVENNIEYTEVKRKLSDDRSNIKLTDETVKKMIRDFRLGVGVKELSKEYGVSETRIYAKIYEKMPLEEIRFIQRRSKNKKYCAYEKSIEIIELFEQGKKIPQIAEIFGCSTNMVKKVLEAEYKKNGKKRLPKSVSKEAFLRFQQKGKYTREEIIEEAKKIDMIIPIDFLDEYYGKQEIDVKKIRRFVINQFADNKLEEQEEKFIFKNFNVAKILKENKYDEKHQAIALLYSLPQITKTSYEEISKAIDNDEEMMQAIRLINGNEKNIGEYLKNLQQSQMATNVKVAITLEELKEKNLNQTKINLLEYEPYYIISKDTNLNDAYNLAINENERYGDER